MPAWFSTTLLFFPKLFNLYPSFRSTNDATDGKNEEYQAAYAVSFSLREGLLALQNTFLGPMGALRPCQFLHQFGPYFTTSHLDAIALVVEGAFMDVASAFRNFFASLKSGKRRGYPKFKRKKRCRQAFYVANDRFIVGDHWVEISKLGRVNMAEKLRLSGKILSARVSKTASWWFISITVELPDETTEPPPLPPVGLDAGLNRLATLSDSRQFENQNRYAPCSSSFGPPTRS